MAFVDEDDISPRFGRAIDLVHSLQQLRERSTLACTGGRRREK